MDPLPASPREASRRDKFDPQKHHRRSIRRKGYDYAQAGAYYVTIVTYQRDCLFGEIIDGKMYVNEYGRIVQKWWNEISNHFPNVDLGAFVIMPNHVHGIISITAERRGEVLSPQDGETNEQGGEIPPQREPRGNDEPNRICRGEVLSPRDNPNNNNRDVNVIGMDDQGRGEVISPRDDPNNNNQGGVTNGQGGETPPLPKPTLGQIVAYFKYQSTKEMNQIETREALTKFWQRNYYEHIIRDKKDLQHKTDYINANPMLWHEDDDNPINVHPA